MSPHYFVETHQPSTRLIGVGIFDNDLRFVAVNSVLAKMNGVPLEKHLGRRLRDVLGAGAIRIEHAVESVLSSQ